MATPIATPMATPAASNSFNKSQRQSKRKTLVPSSGVSPATRFADDKSSRTSSQTSNNDPRRLTKAAPLSIAGGGASRHKSTASGSQGGHTRTSIREAYKRKETKYNPRTGRRCVPCSARARREHTLQERNTQELYEAEAYHWREAMASMGGLARAAAAAEEVEKQRRERGARTSPTPATELVNDDQGFPAFPPWPFHCSAKPRWFGARYQTYKPLTFKRFHRTFREPLIQDEVKAHRACPQGEAQRLPQVLAAGRGPLSAWREDELHPCTLGELFPELPKTCVNVRPSEGCALTEWALCSWLSTFGTVVFSIPFAEKSYHVAFDDMMAAHRCVAGGSARRDLAVTWAHNEMNNFGHVGPLRHYRLTKDPNWAHYMQMLKEK